MNTIAFETGPDNLSIDNYISADWKHSNQAPNCFELVSVLVNRSVAVTGAL